MKYIEAFVYKPIRQKLHFCKSLSYYNQFNWEGISKEENALIIQNQEHLNPRFC
jgi:hypothetical protein